ncbi:MAG: hypothetical protein Q9N34_03295 [Aquificota bacterium]|nr:hypothetical protein [Aquificota bacterium]
MLKESHLYPSLEVDVETHSLDIENIATGVFSPLKGFMTEEELLSVAYKMQLPQGVVWTIPVILQLREKPNLSIGDRVLIRDRKGVYKAVLDIKEIFRLNLAK